MFRIFTKYLFLCRRNTPNTKEKKIVTKSPCKILIFTNLINGCSKIDRFIFNQLSYSLMTALRVIDLLPHYSVAIQFLNLLFLTIPTLINLIYVSSKSFIIFYKTKV